MKTDMDDNNTFEFLIASDIHLGHNEGDRILGKDSFHTFDEIMDRAVKNEIDFVLLGGDLFDHYRPSLYCIHECIKTLREYCTKEKAVKFKFERDQSNNTNQVNFEEHSHVKISLPVFSIHGNHDDRTAHWHLGPLDVLRASGLVNYFGFCDNLDKVEIRPLILTKGSTRIALYGLGYINDRKLSNLFIQRKVKFIKAEKDCFCILVLHQNRVKRGPNENSYIKEEYLPKIFHLIIWGHEHDKKWDDSLHLQPGSSVATSLKRKESGEKYVYHVTVCGLNLKLSKIRLESVRPFVFDELHVSLPSSKQKKEVEEEVTEHINQMIENAKTLLTGHPHQDELPLIRLKLYVDHEEHVINALELGKKFREKVANYKSIILQPLKKNKETLSEEPVHMRGNHALSIETALEKIFLKGENGKHKLKVISFYDLLKTVKEVDVDDNEKKKSIAPIVEGIFKKQLNDIVEKIKRNDEKKDEDSVINQLEKYKMNETIMQSNINSQNLNIKTEEMDVQPGPSCSSQIEHGSGDSNMEKNDDDVEILEVIDRTKEKRTRDSSHSGSRKKKNKVSEEKNPITKYFCMSPK